MKKIFAVITALLLCALLTGCAEIMEPSTAPEEIAGTKENRDERDEDVETALTEQPDDETTEEQSEAEPEEDTGSWYKPTEAVSYSDAGIPITNAYFPSGCPPIGTGIISARRTTPTT